MNARKLIAATLIALSLSGCSYLSGAFVGGNEVNSILSAEGDALLEMKIPVKVLPACDVSGNTYTCKGSTTDGREILVTATGDSGLPMKILVGQKEVFSGMANDVLARSAQRGGDAR